MFLPTLLLLLYFSLLHLWRLALHHLGSLRHSQLLLLRALHYVNSPATRRRATHCAARR